jgi:hypothetical protein
MMGIGHHDESARSRGGQELADTTVVLAVPPRPEFFATVRAVARSVSALADLVVSDVEELQIAVGEAALLLARIAAEGEPLEVIARIAPGSVSVTLSARCADGAAIDTSGMAWLMLTGLVPDLHVTRENETTSIAIERWPSGGER